MNDYVIAIRHSIDDPWTMVYLYTGSWGLDSAKRASERLAKEHPKSAWAIFPRSSDGPYWADRKPYAIYNRHILTQNAPISSNLSGVINSKDSDWF